ncbi:MAG: hypothetical protein IJA34_16480 [Lachnospiraceae bacterium]|nr:hypothetical protein [Lachnospiraceae bacterium]
MDIILDVFKELKFVLQDEFPVEYILNEKNSKTVNVNVLISSENDSQVFLMVDCDNSLLKNMVDGMLIKEMAFRFRKREYHRAEMDKNTSLLIVSKHCVNEDIDTSSKVKIEDDPYYFKKYVFSYDEIGLENADNWLIENRKEGTTVSLIQDYITDTGKFAKYKENNINEPIYTFFIELVTKLHCFPMKTAETKNIKSIDYFLENELCKLRTKQKKTIDIDKKSVEAFVDMDIDFGNLNDVCEKWNLLLGTGSEDKK